MRKQSFRWIIIGGMIVMIIMFGIDVATHGVERVYGPVTVQEGVPVGRLTENYSENKPAESAPRRKEQAVYEDTRPRPTVGEAARSRDRGEYVEEPEPVYEKQERLPGIPDTRKDSKVNKLADGTAGVLQSLSSQGIRMVVNFFEAVTD
ncbi:hypothetical protein [Paenibacillus sp. GCM10027626]|uniref:hypothetical protein n=1 Tax=Paenibacillus sp. GCM10027626 TaxID=3273411 RepID=UPI00362B70B2